MSAVIPHIGEPATLAGRREHLEEELARIELEELQLRLMVRDIEAALARARWCGTEEEIRELEERRAELDAVLARLAQRREELRAGSEKRTAPVAPSLPGAATGATGLGAVRGTAALPAPNLAGPAGESTHADEA